MLKQDKLSKNAKTVLHLVIYDSC